MKKEWIISTLNRLSGEEKYLQSHTSCVNLSPLSVSTHWLFFFSSLLRHSLYPNGVFGKMAEVSSCTWWDFRWCHDLISRIHLDSRSVSNTAISSLCRCIIARDSRHFWQGQGIFLFRTSFSFMHSTEIKPEWNIDGRSKKLLNTLCCVGTKMT